MKLYTSKELWKPVVWGKSGENKDVLTAIDLAALTSKKKSVFSEAGHLQITIEKRENYRINFSYPTLANADVCAYAEANDPVGGLEITCMHTCVHLSTALRLQMVYFIQRRSIEK